MVRFNPSAAGGFAWLVAARVALHRSHQNCTVACRYFEVCSLVCAGGNGKAVARAALERITSNSSKGGSVFRIIRWCSGPQYCTTFAISALYSVHYCSSCTPVQCHTTVQAELCQIMHFRHQFPIVCTGPTVLLGCQPPVPRTAISGQTLSEIEQQGSVQFLRKFS